MKRIFTVLLFFMIFSACSRAEDWDIKYDERGIPLVEVVLLNDKHTLMLDTGSSNGMHLHRDKLERLARSLNQKIEPSQVQRLVDINGNERQVSTLLINKLEVSNVYFNNFDVIELKPWGLTIGSEQPTSEVMGLGMFDNQRIMVDFKMNKIQFINSLPINIQNWSPYLIQKTDSGLAIRTYVDNKTLHFIIDTAASHSITFNHRLPHNIKRFGCDIISPKSLSLDCSVIEFDLKNKHSQVDKGFAIAVDLPKGNSTDFDGLLGMSFMKGKKIIFDLPNNHLYIKK
ncbi:hypothetical protein [Providencia manganoxydans]|uniref:hypothetical protein n=1 Tax=Providencia manganoxydans TaxID=2923283 RepID=UPI00280DAA53|nr:hypothetical protein [Providencia stuartii]ELR5083834.1 hypothetical protein [Providencia stuartii]